MRFCVKCGEKIENDSAMQCPACGQSMTETGRENPSETMGFSMKWFRFAVKYYYYLSAVSSFFNALAPFMAATDERYGRSDLPGIFLLLGVFYLCIGAWQLLLRSKLAGFKQDAFKHFILLNACNLAGQLLFLVASNSEGLGTITNTNIVSLLAVGIIFALEYVYYNKRKELFTK